MKRGLVVGKFYPPHKGHKYLIDTALSQTDYLYVGVIDTKGQSIPAHIRAGWITEIHPNADVHVIPDIYDDDDSQKWADYTREFLGYTPDAVFTSEDYGITWAQCLATEHVMVDRQRHTYPVSGTQIRNNTFEQWDFLEPPVKAHFTKRICILGAESTGTTTLSKALAQHYGTNWVPEYGRFYTEGRGLATPWHSHEFDIIAQVQNQTEDTLARTAHKLLICDTDAFATRLWHERYVGTLQHGDYDINKHELYIVTSPDIPFVQDGLRDGEHIRTQMHHRFIELLEKLGKKYLVVSGPHHDRLLQSTTYIDSLLSQKSYI